MTERETHRHHLVPFVAELYKPGAGTTPGVDAGDEKQRSVMVGRVESCGRRRHGQLLESRAREQGWSAGGGKHCELQTDGAPQRIRSCR